MFQFQQACIGGGGGYEERKGTMFYVSPSILLEEVCTRKEKGVQIIFQQAVFWRNLFQQELVWGCYVRRKGVQTLFQNKSTIQHMVV